MDESNSVSTVILNLNTIATKGVCLQGIDYLKKLQNVTFKGCGVVIVLASIICVCPELISWITGLDVMDKILVSDVTDGWACVQYDPVLVNDICGRFLFCGLVHGEYHLQWLWSSAEVGRGWWEISVTMSCLLAAIACNFWEGYPIFYWCCLILLSINTSWS